MIVLLTNYSLPRLRE